MKTLVSLLCISVCLQPAHTQGPPSDDTAKNATVKELIATVEARKQDSILPALQRLREIGDNSAVPALASLLEEPKANRTIWRLAAAQALFCIATSDARRVLDKYVLDPDWPTDFSIDYAYHWNMPRVQREAFIRQYHLLNTSNELAVSLTVGLKPGTNVPILVFRGGISNESRMPLRIFRPELLAGKLLFVQSPSGRLLPTLDARARRWGMDIDRSLRTNSFRVLAHGEQYRFEIEARVHREDVTMAASQWEDDHVTNCLFMDCIDFIHPVDGFGKVSVWAFYRVDYQDLEMKGVHEQRPGTMTWQTDLDSRRPRLWIGRAMSKPVQVDFTPRLLSSPWYKKGGPFGGFIDPIDDDPKYANVLRRAEEEAKREMGATYRKFGAINLFWRVKKRILKERYNIEWKTPQELNPSLRAD